MAELCSQCRAEISGQPCESVVNVCVECQREARIGLNETLILADIIDISVMASDAPEFGSALLKENILAPCICSPTLINDLASNEEKCTFRKPLFLKSILVFRIICPYIA